ncbi:MAG: hypothetical protein RR139_10920 [Lachnospiraceae bacterium]
MDNAGVFYYIGACPGSWTTPVGASPTTVIASEPYSQTRCITVMQGAKRVGNVILIEVQTIMQTVT